MQKCYQIAFLIFISFGFAQQEVVAPHIRVIFNHPELESYALEVAKEAEQALEVLRPYFGDPKQPIVITINNNTDIFNGFASPLPRPKVSIRALFPNDGGLSFGANSALFFLLIHELTHVKQLAYTEQLESSFSLPKLGLVGEDTARVPPMWFLEGIATWIESEYTQGGRRDDAFTKGLLYTLVQSDHFPTLDDISLDTFGDWPGGNARYLLGVSFLDYLINSYGFETILEVLRDFNTGLLDGFSASWERVTGKNLFTEWENWKALLEQEAQGIQVVEQTLLTETSSFTSSPVFSPDGKQLAWVSMPSKIVIADFDGAELINQKTIIDGRFPDTLDWLDGTTLIYSRIVRQPGTEFLELFSLDIQTGKETQLTQNARAHIPKAMPDGCILFLRDLPQEGSKLQRYCEGVIADFWIAPEGTHIVGLDVSPEGKMVLSLWQEGHVDIAILENQQLTFLTQDAFQDLHPVWQDETRLVFSSDITGIFELHRISLSQEGIGKEFLTQSLGGAFQSTATNDAVLYTTLGADGYDLALFKPSASMVMLTTTPVDLISDVDLSSDIQRPDWNNESQEENSQPSFQIRPYSSTQSMKPYGWLPSFGVSLSPLGLEAGMSIFSLDDSNQHSLTVDLAYDTTLKGHLYGATVYGRYGYHENSVYTSLLPAYPLGFGVHLGVWEHSGHLALVHETALGIQGFLTTTMTLDRWVARGRLEVGLLHLQSFKAFQPDLRLEASLSQLSLDDWSYRTRGQRFGVTGVWSATVTGGSFGAWADAVYYRPLPILNLPGTLELALRAGYRQSPVVALDLEDWAAVGLVGYRMSFPIEWRIDDGVYSLERLTLEPRLRPYFDGAFGLAGDVTLSADTVLGYGAPVSLSLSLGYADGFWYALGWRLPL